MALRQKVEHDFDGKRVVVAGDAVADQFLEGTISRVSREAPVFILRHDQTDTLPGAAANAAANVAAMSGQASLIGFCGADANGQALRSSLAEKCVDTRGLLEVPGLSTNTKVRVLAGHSYATRQQVIRIDYEETIAIGPEYYAALLNEFHIAAAASHAIVISDYGYGAVTPAIFEEARRVMAKRNVPLILDSRHRLETFAGATSATPNREEVEQILGKNFTSEDCSKLRERLGLEALLVTNGNEGMTIYESGSKPFILDVVGSQAPVDVTGAGDTVIAAYSLGLASGLSFREAAEIANHAGGLVVMKKGTATVTKDELIASLASSREDASLAQSK